MQAYLMNDSEWNPERSKSTHLCTLKVEYSKPVHIQRRDVVAFPPSLPNAMTYFPNTYFIYKPKASYHSSSHSRVMPPWPPYLSITLILSIPIPPIQPYQLGSRTNLDYLRDFDCCFDLALAFPSYPSNEECSPSGLALACFIGFLLHINFILTKSWLNDT